MIGRASIGYPWIFNEIKHYLKTGDHLPAPDLKARVEAVKEHLKFSVSWKGERKGIYEMRRHYTNYFRGIPNFKPYRTQLVEAETESLIHSILQEISEVFSPALAPV